MLPKHISLHSFTSPTVIDEITCLKAAMAKQAKEELGFLPDGQTADVEDVVEKTYQDIAHVVVLLDMRNENVLGHVILSKSNPNLVKGVYVEPEYRRLGYGKKMMEFLQENHGGEALLIGVLANNVVAIEFFETMGYEVRRLSYS